MCLCRVIGLMISQLENIAITIVQLEILTKQKNNKIQYKEILGIFNTHIKQERTRHTRLVRVS